MNNYYNIVKTILQVASKHKFVSETHYGDIFEFLNSGDHKYINCTLVEQSGSQYNEDFNTFNFVLYITDRLDDSGSNLLEVHSVTKSISEQILEQLLEENPDWTITSESFTPFKWKFSDLCAGIFVNLAIQVPAELLCSEEEVFTPKTLTITSNGTYSTIGYDQAEVDVHSDDELSIFTLYPSNYFNTLVVPNANTKIEAKIQFTGDGDYIFAMDADGLTGIKYNEEENQTYAGFLNNSEDWVPLNLHKDFWQKGAYKVILAADKCQIGYYTFKLNENKVTGTFRNQIYIGYDGNETSSMEIYSVKISHQYPNGEIGVFAEFVPKIVEGKVKIVDSISGNDVEIRTVYSQTQYNDDILKFLNNGGTFAYSTFNELPKFDWSKLDKPNYDYFLYQNTCTWADVQNLLNIYTDNKSFKECTRSIKITDTKEEVTITMPKGFKNSKNQDCILEILATHPGLKLLTVDFTDVEYTGSFLAYTTGFRVKLLNTSQLKRFYNPTSNLEFEAFDCSSMQWTPYYGVHNQTTYIGGFIDLGKGFLQNGTSVQHTMYFDAYMQNLSKESLLNIFNGLYDLNLLVFTFVNQPTIKMGAANFAKVTDEDIKIATDKGWIVTQ